jgi:hypothetical protein
MGVPSTELFTIPNELYTNAKEFSISKKLIMRSITTFLFNSWCSNKDLSSCSIRPRNKAIKTIHTAITIIDLKFPSGKNLTDEIHITPDSR